MRVLGFDTMDFVLPTSAAGSSIEGYVFGIREDNMLVNTVEATVIPRPGTYPTFGIGVVGAMYLQGEFGYGPPGVLTYEAAFQNLWKRLNPSIATPRELRVQRNADIGSSTFQKIMAVLQIPQFSSTQALNFKDSTFVCAYPWFLAAGYTTGTGGFA